MKSNFFLFCSLLLLEELFCPSQSLRAQTISRSAQCKPYDCKNITVMRHRDLLGSVKVLIDWVPNPVVRNASTTITSKRVRTKSSKASIEAEGGASIGSMGKARILAQIIEKLQLEFKDEQIIEIEVEPILVKPGQQARYIQMETAIIYQFDYFDPSKNSWRKGKAVRFEPFTKWEYRNGY
jgi:hypothetical protein